MSMLVRPLLSRAAVRCRFFGHGARIDCSPTKFASGNVFGMKAVMTNTQFAPEAALEVQGGSASGAEGAAARSFKALIPVRLNLLLATIFVVAQLYVLALYPLDLIGTPSLAIAVLVAAVVLAYPCWVLIHEAIHSMLSPHRR